MLTFVLARRRGLLIALLVTTSLIHLTGGDAADRATLAATITGAQRAELRRPAAVTAPPSTAAPATTVPAEAPAAPDVPTEAAGVPAAEAAPPAPEPSSAVVDAAAKGLPVGKGMWTWLPERTEGGNADAIVARSLEIGLTHIYVRTGSSWQDFNNADFLNRILPAAHNAGLKVYGWDFPSLKDIPKDINRGLMAIGYVTPDGHRLDGFVPDIETAKEGTNLHADTVRAYMTGLRTPIGSFPLIVCVPRPSQRLMTGAFPYREAIEHADAVAPMIYWLNRQPETDTWAAFDYLYQFGKPIIPVGQGYDGGPEGGRPGPPPADEIDRFMKASEDKGGIGASLWSWQHVSPEIWYAISDSPHFEGAEALVR
jgi:hypothetical protein